MSIKRRVMDLIAKRDHSEKELRQKLSRVKKWDNKKERLYTDEEIASVISWARDNRWLQEGSYLSERWADTLNKRKKGIKYINAYLNQKGLPAVSKNQEVEVDKALNLLRKKIQNKAFQKAIEDAGKMNQEIRLKLTRFLISRGFDQETIRSAFKQL
jgi:regulatory protein